MESIVKQIEHAVMENNTVETASILDKYCPRGAMRSDVIRKAVAFATLKTATAMAFRDKLDENLARMLIEHLTAMTATWHFLQSVIAIDEIDGNMMDAIPDEMRVALECDTLPEQVIHELKFVDNTTFKAILAYIAYGTESIDFRVKEAIFQGIFDRKIVPWHLMFFYMSESLVDSPFAESSFDFLQAFEAFFGKDAVMALISECYGEDGCQQNCEHCENSENHEDCNE